MQPIAPPDEAIQAAINAAIASCAAGTIIGAIAGTRMAGSLLRTCLLASATSASALLAFGTLIRFQSFPLHRAVDRSPWAIAIGCLLAVLVACISHIFCAQTAKRSQSTLKLLGFAAIGVSLRSAAIASSLLVAGWRLASTSWTIGQTLMWIAPVSVLGAIAWTMVSNAGRVRRHTDNASQSQSHASAVGVFTCVIVPLLICGGVVAKSLLDAGLSTFPPAIGATLAGITAAFVSCAVTHRMVYRNAPHRWQATTQGLAGAAIVVLASTWLIGMWTSSAHAWISPVNPALAGFCLLLGVSVPSLFLGTTFPGTIRTMHVPVRLGLPILVAAILCAIGAAILHAHTPISDSGEYDYDGSSLFLPGNRAVHSL